MERRWVQVHCACTIEYRPRYGDDDLKVCPHCRGLCCVHCYGHHQGDCEVGKLQWVELKNDFSIKLTEEE